MKRIFSLLLLLALLLSGCGMDTAPATTAPAPGAEGMLQVHFIDVGQADCALLECGGEYMLIDGGNVEDSSLVVSYLQKQGVQELAAVVCSHAHEDHVGGLPGVLAVFPTKAVYAPTRTYSSKCFDDFVYYVNQQDLQIQIPAPGDTVSFAGTSVTVLGPVKSYAETNDTSIVLKVVYGETSFLFTGDMETSAENDMLDHWSGRGDLRADVLKVGHHGSSTSTGYRFLYEVDPDYGVISVGEGNSYGHPNEEPLSRLADADVTLYRTDLLGTVIASTDGKDITFTWQKASARPEDPTAPEEAVQYIGNVNSKKLHLPDCANLPNEENRITFDSYDEAIAAGYTPCGTCMK